MKVNAMNPELEKVLSELIQHGEMSQEALNLLVENERLQKKLKAELAEAQASRTRILRNSSKRLSFVGWSTAAACTTIQGRVLTDSGVDPTQVSVGLYQPSEFLMKATQPKEDGTFRVLFHGEGPAHLTVNTLAGEVLRQVPVTLVRGTTSHTVIDLRSCESSTCGDWPAPVLSASVTPTVPAKPALVPTRDVQVWEDGVRRGNAPRRCLMRAFMLGTGMLNFGLVRFVTADGRRLKPQDIDWTGFGLKPIIARRRVLVFQDGRPLGPLERAYVLEGFRQSGALPEGCEFPKAIWNLTPQDVNWECE